MTVYANILVAYPYGAPGVMQTLADLDKKTSRVIIDSGAFTAWKLGTPITLDEYCNFIERYQSVPWRYFALDVVGNEGGTLANYREMLRRGFKPVPVFTRGSDPAILEEYYATSDLVAIGGLVGTHRNDGYVFGLNKHVKGRAVHLLGYTKAQALRRLKPYSCDSSSWMESVRFGNLQILDGLGLSFKLNKRMFRERPSSKIIAAIQRYGFDPFTFRKDGEWRSKGAVVDLSSASAVERAALLEENIGTLSFLACTTKKWVERVVRGQEIVINMRSKP